MKAGEKSTSRKERTRQSVLASAAQCFGAFGFAESSMDLVAERAGVTKPTLYAHFDSKDGLFEALLRELFTRLRDGVLPAVTTREELREALAGHAEAHISMLLQSPNLGLLRASAAEVMRRPAWAQHLMSTLSDDQLQRWLLDANKRGLLRLQNAKTASTFFWSLVKGPLFYPVLLGLRAPPDSRERKRLIKEAVRTFVDAN